MHTVKAKKRPFNYKKEIIRRVRAAGMKEEASVLQQVDFAEGMDHLASAFIFTDQQELLGLPERYFSRIAIALDDLGWEGGWFAITKGGQ